MLLGQAQEDFTAEDLDRHAIWFCDYSRKAEIDFEFTPVLEPNEVTEELCRRGKPGIYLRVEDTQLRCFSYYDHEKDAIDSPAVWIVNEWRGFSYIDAPRTPVILVSMVPIFGTSHCRFLLKSPEDKHAHKL